MRFSEALAKAKEADSSNPSLRELYLDGRFLLAQDDSFQVSQNISRSLHMAAFG